MEKIDAKEVGRIFEEEEVAIEEETVEDVAKKSSDVDKEEGGKKMEGQPEGQPEVKSNKIAVFKDEKKQPQRDFSKPEFIAQIENNPRSKNINGNLMGIRSTGVIYTITTEMLNNYFNGYFNHWGYPNVVFGDSLSRPGTVPNMYFIFPNTHGVFYNGKKNEEKRDNYNYTFKSEFFGEKNNPRIMLDNKFRNAVLPFVDGNENLVVKSSRMKDKSQREYYYITLDPESVLATLFLQTNDFKVVLMDAVSSGGGVIYRIGRIVNSTQSMGGNTIEEIIRHITK